MTKIEELQRYINLTDIPRKLSVRYDAYVDDFVTILCAKNPFEAVCFAFAYGKAKGYRAGKKAATNG